ITPRVLDNPEEQALLDSLKGKVTIFDFGGPLSFGAAADLGHHVRERVKKNSEALILDFSRVPFIDLSAARAVETIANDAADAGRAVYITGMNDAVRAILSGLEADHRLPSDVHFDTRLEALRALARADDGDDIGGNAVPQPA
ncbi:MAG TPA: sodium-independent anion transporter, partial [Amphiplicatus sp.]|nr:sodium-independent anion transporter [Amphiplicatus sp.]